VFERAATDEDNEPTGIHMSEGDSTIHGLIGRKEFKKDRSRLFFTEQRGKNNLLKCSPGLSRNDQPKQASKRPGLETDRGVLFAPNE
jgi:hypothetical protein